MTKRIILLALLVILAGCGGGGGGGSTPPPNLAPGKFGITDNPNKIDADLPSFTHDGNMLIVNPDGSSKKFWCQRIDVVPNRDYTFSAQGRSLTGTLVTVEWLINDEAFLQEQLPSGRFVTMNAEWNSGTNNVIELCGRNVTPTSEAAFAIDNIKFIGPPAECNDDGTPVNPDPQPPTNPEPPVASCNGVTGPTQIYNNGLKGFGQYYEIPCDGHLEIAFDDDNAHVVKHHNKEATKALVEKNPGRAHPYSGPAQVLMACDNELMQVKDYGSGGRGRWLHLMQYSTCAGSIPQHGAMMCTRDGAPISGGTVKGGGGGCSKHATRQHKVAVKAGDYIQMFNSDFAAGGGSVIFTPSN